MNRQFIVALTIFSLVIMAYASDAQAQLTYFDANVTGYQITTKVGTTEFEPNTTLVDGSPVPTTGDGSGADNLWRIRSDNGFGNKPDPAAENIGGGEYLGDILEARGQNGGPNTEDVPTLKTTVAVPGADQGQEKSVWVIFWADGSPWQVAASLTNSNDGQPSQANPLQPVFGANNSGNDFGMMRDIPNDDYARSVHDASEMGGMLPDFATNPLFMPNDSFLTTTDGNDSGGPAGNRRLWAGFLGNTVLGSDLTVFVGEGFALTEAQAMSNGGANFRTWYDGIAYGDPVAGLAPLADVVPVIPEPSAVILLGMGAIFCCVARRRSR